MPVGMCDSTLKKLERLFKFKKDDNHTSRNLFFFYQNVLNLNQTNLIVKPRKIYEKKN